MTTGTAPMCAFCRHFQGGKRDVGLTCAAFPGGIPESILQWRLDHRAPVDGDGGIQFEQNEDMPSFSHDFGDVVFTSGG